MDKKNTLIAVICYNSIEFWKSRTKAIKFYRDAARFSDGCESERYSNIVWALMDGKNICEDGSSWDYQYLHDKNQYHQFKNGTNCRDLTGRVEYPTDTYGLIMDISIVG